MDTAEITVRILLSLFLVSVGGGESRTVRGYPGGGVLIRCRYEKRYTSNPKYLCRGSWPCLTKPVRTEVKNEWSNTGRFSLLDNTSSAEFWVMIRDLTVQDSRTYRCAVDIDLAIDVYTQVDLTVEEDLSYEKSISVTGLVGGGVNISCKYPQTLSSYPKFLCRRVGTADCNYVTPVKESRRWRNGGNLNLHDDRAKKTLTVRINDLTEGDSGEYWCGAESNWTSDDGYKVYITQVHLRVTGPSNNAQVSSTLYEEVKDTRHRSTSDAWVTTVYSTAQPPSQTVYGNVQIPSNSSDFSNPVYSAVSLPSNPPDQDAYSTTQLPTIPSDSSISAPEYSTGDPANGPEYATVKFSKTEGSSTVVAAYSRENDSCDYTTRDICPLLVGGGESRTVRGYPGGGVLIRCRYETKYTSNPKYFCKSGSPNCADQIRTGDKNEWRSTGRFSLLDNTSSAEFWVMIRDLTVQDYGLYQCAVEIDWQRDFNTPVELTVKEDLSYEKSISVIGHVGGGVKISCTYPQSLNRDPKFLCRRVGTAECKYKTSVKESRRWKKEGNLNLHDDRATQTFTVKINSLTGGESGEYWCGAESDWTSDHGYKVYITQVHLKVTDVSSTDPLKSSTGSLNSTSDPLKSSTDPLKSSTGSLNSTSDPLNFPTHLLNSPTGSLNSPTGSLASESITSSSTSTPRTTLLSSPSMTSSSPASFSGLTLVPVPLVLILIGLLFLFIFALRRRRKTQGSASTQSQSLRGPANEHTVPLTVSVYEEVKDTRCLSASDVGGSSVYSTAHLPIIISEPPQAVYDNIQSPSSSSDFSNPVYSTAQLPLNPSDQDTYSMAQLPTLLPASPESDTQDSAGKSAEGLTYTTVNFNNEEGSSAEAVTFNKEKESCDYSTVNHRSIVGGGESRTVRGYPGGGVLIRCRYERGYTLNPKYLCIAPWPCRTKPVWTGVKNEWRSTGRFSLLDNTSSAEFWVMIRDLTVQDSGLYQCAVDKTLNFDVYTPVELTVEEDLSYEKSISVTGLVGGGVNISCKYPKSLSRYPKFLCRRVGTADCIDSRRWSNEGRFSLGDGNQTFTVSFNNLTEGDSGEYWCGAELDWTSDDGYKVYITQVNLRVTGTSASSTAPENTMTTSSSPGNSSFETSKAARTSSPISSLSLELTTTSKTTPSSSPARGFLASSVIAVVFVILVLLLPGLLFFKRLRPQGLTSIQSQPLRDSTKKVPPTVYEEVKDSRHHPASVTGESSVYSTAQLPTNISEPSQIDYENVYIPSNCGFLNPVFFATQLPSNPPDQDFYSIAQLPTIPSSSSVSAAQTSAEGPTYATVNFNSPPPDSPPLGFPVLSVITGASVILVLLLIGLLILTLRKRRKAQGSASIQSQSLGPFTSEHMLPSNPPDQDIYSMAQLPTILSSSSSGTDGNGQRDVYTPVELTSEKDPIYRKIINVTGRVGGAVNISCKYPQSLRSDSKFLCKRANNSCIYKISGNESRRWRKEGGFSLHDDGNQTFTVNITNLTERHSGKYWCGAESDWTSGNGSRVYITLINLRVTGFPVLSVITGVSVILVLLLIGLFILALRKRKKAQGSASTQSQFPRGSANDHTAPLAVSDYEEVKDTKDAIYDNVEIHPCSSDLSNPVYSSVGLPSNPSDQDTYSPYQDYQKVINVTGDVGGGVTISCKYPQSLSSDSRFLCRRVNSTQCNDRISDKESRKERNDRRFSLHDDGNQTFTVNISSLTEGDSGEYWCGAEVNWTSGDGYKVYTTQVKLRVTGE
ncbi:hypothetical protein NFI96_023098 [Prochilodus magdalenae]|nr:hypothetical protein NFI96_023098 [Prochilodus magdalenae]